MLHFEPMAGVWAVILRRFVAGILGKIPLSVSGEEGWLSSQPHLKRAWTANYGMAKPLKALTTQASLVKCEEGF
jgi:hypothetical protein